jgi:alpha-tubulin suppressor-like RCC1 family protein
MRAARPRRACIRGASIAWAILGIGVSVQQTFSTPQDVTALDCKNVVAIAAGAQHVVALTGSGQVYVWGGGVKDTLGDGSIESSDVPVLNAAATALTGGTSSGVEVTAGSSIGGILVNGQAYVWGNNKQGECGCGSTMGGVDTPSAVEQGGVHFSFIDQGGDIGNNGHTLALTAAGEVYAWGTGTNGQLGQGNTTNTSVPVLVPGLPVITDVRAGGVHSMALDAGGNVWGWGGNADGQVGNGTLTDVHTPVDVESGIGMISAGDVHSLSA